MDTFGNGNPRIIIAKKPVAVTTGQCDACPSTLSLSMGGDSLNVAAEYFLPQHSILINLDNDFRIICREDMPYPVVLNESGWGIFSQFRIPRTLNDLVLDSAVKDFLAQSVSTGLLHSTDISMHLKEQAGPLVAWIHITDKCNLRCAYCYLPHMREDMSFETGKAVIESIFRSAVLHGYREIKLKYPGGEPILNFPLIFELNGLAASFARQNGISLDSVILSNGTLLTPDMVNAMRHAGIRLMISLDGLGIVHDAHRPYVSGCGSFEDVSRAISIALDYGLVPDISITISNQTIAGLSDLLGWVLEWDLPFSLNFYRDNPLSLSSDNLGMEDEQMINGMLAAYKVIEDNLPRRSLFASLIDRANLAEPHLRTCGVGQNYLVFDQNGQVAKCQMQIHKTVADSHTIDPLADIRADQIGIQNLPVENKAGCKICEWKYWCTGGCALEAHRVLGRYDVKSPNCNIYKVLFAEALRLEGLRLLKYQDDPEVVMKL